MSRYNFCITGTEVAIRHASAPVPTATRQGAPVTRSRRGPRYGLACATIRSSVRHDTASCVRPEHSVRAAWSIGCAPNPVLTQDTVLSQCLNHCS